MATRRDRRGAVEYEIDTSVLDQIMENLHLNVSQAVRATAFAIEAKAKVLGKVDTGAMVNSIYVRVGKQPSELPVMKTEKQLEASEGKRVELPEPENEFTAHVGPSVEYGLYQELGTRNMPAHPFLGPAVNQAASELVHQMSNAVTNNKE